ncbi:hypothetical protein FB45DRAFT_898837 [Roridomyces roridus]|uniref:Uncharacterized protein n=1 Tax=Roridomyces roridus TaxID=1738132 RepID=A0AAD7CCW6_9AGAR|nr:hypothetical protein FB45DRAFT_898837 [Roridomyces roridus]
MDPDSQSIALLHQAIQERRKEVEESWSLITAQSREMARLESQKYSALKERQIELDRKEQELECRELKLGKERAELGALLDSVDNVRDSMQRMYDGAAAAVRDGKRKAEGSADGGATKKKKKISSQPTAATRPVSDGNLMDKQHSSRTALPVP